MSANLNENNGKVSFASTKPAWHNSGTIVENAMNSEEAIKLAGLDYSVEKKEIFLEDGTKISDNFATVRMDNNVPLGIVGSKYHVLQNKDAFKFFDDIVGSKECIYETAGALGKGERVFITAKMPEKCVVGLDDVIDNYLFITNSHDGSGSVEIAFTQVRIVCANTLKIALGQSKRKQKIRHTLNLNTSLFKASDLMGLTRQRIQETQELFNAMSKVEIKGHQLRKFIELAMNPAKEQIDEETFSTRFINTVDKVLEYSAVHPSQAVSTARGTLFGALNSVTGYYNNVQTYKSGDDRVNSIMYGTAFRNSSKAFDLAMSVLQNDSILS